MSSSRPPVQPVASTSTALPRRAAPAAPVDASARPAAALARRRTRPDGFAVEADEDVDMDEEDTADDEDDDEGVSISEIAKIVKSFTTSRTKKDKASQAKMENEMKASLATARANVDKMIASRNERVSQLASSLELDKRHYIGSVLPENYAKAAAEQDQSMRDLEQAIDRYLDENWVDKLEFVKDAKAKLEARRKLEKRTKHKLDKVLEVVVAERDRIAALHDDETKRTMRHLRAALR